MAWRPKARSSAETFSYRREMSLQRSATMEHGERLVMGPGPANPYPEAMEAFGRPVLGEILD